MLLGYESPSLLSWRILGNAYSYTDAANLVRNSSLLINADFFIVGSLEWNEAIIMRKWSENIEE